METREKGVGGIEKWWRMGTGGVEGWGGGLHFPLAFSVDAFIAVRNVKEEVFLVVLLKREMRLKKSEIKSKYQFSNYFRPIFANWPYDKSSKKLRASQTMIGTIQRRCPIIYIYQCKTLPLVTRRTVKTETTRGNVGKKPVPDTAAPWLLKWGEWRCLQRRKEHPQLSGEFFSGWGSKTGPLKRQKEQERKKERERQYSKYSSQIHLAGEFNLFLWFVSQGPSSLLINSLSSSEEKADKLTCEVRGDKILLFVQISYPGFGGLFHDDLPGAKQRGTVSQWIKALHSTTSTSPALHILLDNFFLYWCT